MMSYYEGFLAWMIILGSIPVLVIVFLILAIFEMNKNIKAIRRVLDKNFIKDYPEEAWIYEEKIKKEEPKEEWIYEEKKKEPKEPKESIWNKKIF